MWLDPHRSVVGGHMYLEAHCEPPGTSREKFSRSSRRPHSFRVTSSDGIDVLTDFGQLSMPDELHLEQRGWVNKRIEAFWNGCIFVVDESMEPESPAVAP